MKKLFMFVIIAVIAVPAFTQNYWGGNRQMAISTDPSPLIIGTLLGGFGINLGFEFAPIQQVSAKFGVHFIGFDPVKLFDVSFDEDDVNVKANITLLRLNLEGRWYPVANYVHGWFVNGGLQFHRLAASAYISFDDESEGGGLAFNTFGICFGVGYKAIFGSSRAGFSFEPLLDFTWPLYSDIPFNEMDVIAGNYIGWLLGIKGVRASLLFGVAF